MPDFDGTADILFSEQDARIVFGEGRATQPLKSHEEILHMIRELCQEGLIPEFTSELLRSKVWKVTLPLKGMRTELLLDGVQFEKIRIIRRSGSCAKPPQTM